MEFDFKAMQAKMSQELASSKTSNSNNGESSGYPLVYVGQNGKLVVKLFYNAKMGGLQRKLIRHPDPADTEGKAKISCMQMYGERDCPICKAIKEIEQAKGEDVGVSKDFGYKARGICYAQIIDYSPVYFTKDTDPKKGDIVMLMYPITIYNKINELMVNAGENVGKLIASNTGFAVELSRTQSGKKFDYTVSLDALRGEVSAFDSVAEYEEFLTNLPNLGDAFVSSTPTEEIRRKVGVSADALMQQYLGSAIKTPTAKSVVPSEPVATDDDDMELPFDVEVPSEPVAPKAVTKKAPKKEKVVAPVEDQEAEKIVEEATPVKEGMPLCFGKHNDSSKECIECDFECECVMNG